MNGYFVGPVIYADGITSLGSTFSCMLYIIMCSPN